MMYGEKIEIMSKVNEGKISPEEGYRLYEALKGQPDVDGQQETKNKTSHSDEDLRKKIHGIYKEVEPYLRETILSALETAVYVADTVKQKVRDEFYTEES